MRLKHALGALVLTTIFVACAAEEELSFDGGPSVSRLDRLTVLSPPERLLTRVDMESGPSDQWSLEPLLNIGSTDLAGDESATLFERLVDVQLLRDGRVAAVDQGALKVSIYSDSGVRETTLGREGDGPSEFIGMEAIRECGERGYFVMEEVKTRMKVFDTDATLLDEYRVFPYNPNQPSYQWDCGDDHVLIMQWGDGDPRVGDLGRFRIPVPLSLSGPDGTMTRALGWILGPERYRFENRATGPAALGAVTGLAVHDRTVYVAEGPELRVDAFSFEGEHLWTLSASVEQRPVDGEAFIESQRPATMTSSEQAQFNSHWRDWDFPEFVPAFRGFLVDDEGLLWFERFPGPDDESITWYVFDQTGIWRASVEVPSNTELTDVRASRAVGIARDELDVQTAVLFSIRTEQTAGSSAGM